MSNVFASIQNAFTPRRSKSAESRKDNESAHGKEPLLNRVLPAPVANMVASTPQSTSYSATAASSSRPNSKAHRQSKDLSYLKTPKPPVKVAKKEIVTLSSSSKPKGVSKSTPKSKGRPKKDTNVKVKQVLETTASKRTRREVAAPTRFVPETFVTQAPKTRKGYWAIKAIIEENEDEYRVQWSGTDPKTKGPYEPQWVAKEHVTPTAVKEWRDLQKGTKDRAQKRKVLKAKKTAKKIVKKTEETTDDEALPSPPSIKARKSAKSVEGGQVVQAPPPAKARIIRKKRAQ